MNALPPMQQYITGTMNIEMVEQPWKMVIGGRPAEIGEQLASKVVEIIKSE